MKKVSTLVILFFSVTNASYLDASIPQGLSPFAIDTTSNGEYLYLSFDLSEDIFKIRQDDLFVVASKNFPEYFPMECENILLDESEKKLFVYTPTWRKLLVLDAETLELIHTIDDMGIIDMIRSQHGSYLVTYDGGSDVHFIDTNTYEITKKTDDSFQFKYLRESNDPSKWYVYTYTDEECIVGKYDHIQKKWDTQVKFAPPHPQKSPHDFKILPNEEKCYLAIMADWYPGYHSYGYLYSIDLVNLTSSIIDVDGGAGCLESSQDSKLLYVGTMWPDPATNNLLILDTDTNEFADTIPLGRTKYGWYYYQMNDVHINPNFPNTMYAVCADANALAKIDLINNFVVVENIFNKEEYRPHYYSRVPNQTKGYILLHQNKNSVKFDVERGGIVSVYPFPSIRDDAYAYDTVTDSSGRMLIVQGEFFLEIQESDKQYIAKHDLPHELPSIWHFILSRDESELYAIGSNSVYPPNEFIALDSQTFNVKSHITLEGGGYNYRPFEIPDKPKIYALGGQHNGPVEIQVIDTQNYTALKHIVFDKEGRNGISAGPYSPFAYDEESKILYVGAMHVVLGIDTVSDEIVREIYIGDSAKAIGLEPNQLTYINITTLLYNPNENYLYLAHLDRSYISIYDLNANKFINTLIPLQGYFPKILFANDNLSKIYCINRRSDSVTVIDVATKTVEKIIDIVIPDSIPTYTPTAKPADTPLPTFTPTNTSASTPTNTPIPTHTPLPTQISTTIPTDTPLPTFTPTNAPTSTPTPSPIPTDIPAPTFSPTYPPAHTPTPKPISVTIPPNTMIVADNLYSENDLAGSFDMDDENERTLAIRWNAGDGPFDDYHIYVIVNDDDGVFLNRMGNGDNNYYEWKQDSAFVNNEFRNGPQFGNRYKFAVFALRNNGKTVVINMEEPVLYLRSGEPTPTSTPTHTPTPKSVVIKDWSVYEE